MHYLDTDGFAGTEQHVLTLLRAQIAMGLETALACREDNADFVQKARQIPGVEVFARPALPLRKALPAFRAQVAAWKPDILHAHNGSTMLQCAVAAGRGGAAPRSVATQHFVDPAHTKYTGLKRRIADILHGYTNKRLTRIIAISDSVRSAAMKREHLSAEKIVTVHNGIEEPQADAKRAKKVLIEMGIETPGPILVTTARLSEEKGHRYLLEAAPEIRRRFPDVRFLWLGTGDMASEIKAQISAAGQSDVIHLLGYRTDAPDFVALADLLVLPSLCEPFGLAVVEAMMLGTPVIATDCGGPPEILRPALPAAPLDDATGSLVPSADAGALAAAVCGLLADPEARREVGRRGQKRAREQFTAQRMAREITQVYEAAQSAAPSGSR